VLLITQGMRVIRNFNPLHTKEAFSIRPVVFVCSYCIQIIYRYLINNKCCSLCCRLPRTDDTSAPGVFLPSPPVHSVPMLLSPAGRHLPVALQSTTPEELAQYIVVFNTVTSAYKELIGTMKIYFS